MRIIVISAQPSFRDAVQAACLRYDKAIVTVRTSETIGQGLELAEQLEAQLVVFDLTLNIEAGLVAIENLSSTRGRMIAVSAEAMDTDLITRAIRAGAEEVLDQPVREEEVHAVLDKLSRRLAEDAPDVPQRDGRLVVVFSSKGGVGKTTIACNLSVALTRIIGAGGVGLVDANQQVPNVAPVLDLRPQRWLREAIREYRRLDETMLEQFLTTHKSGLKVLAHRADTPMEAEFSEDELCKILLICKGRFQYTLVDTFPLLTNLNLAVMDLADHILLVTEAVVPAVRTARYNLQLLKQAGYGTNRITVVLNRYTRFKGNVTPEMVAETLEWPVEVIIPYDVHATIAANQGSTVIEEFPTRPISQAITRLGERIAGRETPVAERSFGERLRRLLLG